MKVHVLFMLFVFAYV